jgi:hypothetical protein
MQESLPGPYSLGSGQLEHGQSQGQKKAKVLQVRLEPLSTHMSIIVLTLWNAVPQSQLHQELSHMVSCLHRAFNW